MHLTPAVFNLALAVPKWCCLCAKSHGCHEDVHAAPCSCSSLAVSVLGTEALESWSVESGCQGTTCSHASKSASLENGVAVCAQAVGSGSWILVSLESCVAKAVAGNAGGVVQPTHRSTVPVGVQSQIPDWLTLNWVRGL